MVGDANRTVSLAGNVTLAGALTTAGAFALTQTAKGVNFNATNDLTIPLVAIVTSPAGNLAVQGFDAGSNGSIPANYSGQGKDTTISVVRIA